VKAAAELRRTAEGIHWRDDSPIVLRPTGPDQVRLVQAAGGPLGGDELALAVTVDAGARLRLGSVAATVAQPGPAGDPSRWRVDLDLGPDADLRWTPEPTVVCAGADHRTELHATVAAGARLVVREVVLLGRSGEPGGRYRGRLAVDVAGEPLLRNESVVDGLDPELSGPAGTGGHRVLGTLVVAGPVGPLPDRPARVEADLVTAVLPLAGPGFLVLALGDTVTAVGAALDQALWTA
jgi:urease accessory protein